MDGSTGPRLRYAWLTPGKIGNCTAPRTAAVSENVGISCRGSRRCVGWRAGASRSVAEVLAVLDSSSDGLDADTARERLTVYGANKLPAKEPRPAHVRRDGDWQKLDAQRWLSGGIGRGGSHLAVHDQRFRPRRAFPATCHACSSQAVRFWLLSLPA